MNIANCRLNFNFGPDQSNLASNTSVLYIDSELPAIAVATYLDRQITMDWEIKCFVLLLLQLNVLQTLSKCS